MSTQPGYSEASHSSVSREGSGEGLGQQDYKKGPRGCPLIEETSLEFKPNDKVRGYCNG